MDCTPGSIVRSATAPADNILIRRYSKCSLGVKLNLFQAYCMCLYDVGIWQYYSKTVFNKVKSCYNKCMKMFFGYDRRYSVTLMLSELNLPDFDSFYVISAKRFYISALTCDNILIKNLTSLQLITSSIPYDSCSTMGLAPAT